MPFEQKPAGRMGRAHSTTAHDVTILAAAKIAIVRNGAGDATHGSLLRIRAVDAHDRMPVGLRESRRLPIRRVLELLRRIAREGQREAAGFQAPPGPSGMARPHAPLRPVRTGQN